MVTILNGKFYKDGKPMPVEFGNKEQAEAFEKAAKYEKELKGGMPLDFSIETTYSGSFKCICGHRFYFDDTTSQEDAQDILAGQNFECKCGKHNYKTYMDAGSVMVKEVS